MERFINETREDLKLIAIQLDKLEAGQSDFTAYHLANRVRRIAQRIADDAKAEADKV